MENLINQGRWADGEAELLYKTIAKIRKFGLRDGETKDGIVFREGRHMFSLHLNVLMISVIDGDRELLVYQCEIDPGKSMRNKGRFVYVGKWFHEGPWVSAIKEDIHKMRMEIEAYITYDEALAIDMAMNLYGKY